MVIGNGFFSDTKEDALQEMTKRSGCKVVKSNFQTVGNICFYVSKKGDLYGQQYIQGKWLTRTKKPERTNSGLVARLSDNKKEYRIRLQVLVYCAFVIGCWEPDVELDFINGNCYDVRPENLRMKQPTIPHEWSERMELRKDVYQSYFLNVMWSVNYTTQLDLQDCKDAAQTAFLYLCTDGYNKTQWEGKDFVGLWIKIARLRAIDFIHVKVRHSSEPLEWLGHIDNGYEFDWFKLQPGEKRQKYLRMFYEGNRPTEIAKECGVSLGTVSSGVTRSMQFMRKYFKHEIEVWNSLR